MKKSRRNFLRNSVIGTTGGMMLGHTTEVKAATYEDLPGVIWVGTVSQEGLRADSPETWTEKIINIMEEMVPSKPDIICLPETFLFLGTGFPTKTQIAEADSAPFPSLDRYKAYAKANSSYVIAPTVIKEEGKAYNAAVLIDRNGNPVWNYKKMHPTDSEMDAGISPGPENQSAYQADFGTIGAQICFDVQWNNGWEQYRDKDVDMMFWPSAFPGGKMVQAKAPFTNAYLVTSVNKGPARICDHSGEEIAKTEFWNRNWICAPVNMEKAILTTWPYVSKFSAIRKKYGRKINIVNYDEEEWSLIESLSPDLRIKDVMKEFDLITYKEHIARATEYQKKMM
ncbi:MAG: carbon-nitrogen hydrolase family protein [Bacteroidota bacterium]